MQEFKREPLTSPDHASQLPVRRGWARTILFSGDLIKSWPVNVGILLLRVPSGVGLAVLHGWQKLPPAAGFVMGLDSLGFPLPYFLALGVGVCEVLAGVLVALGLMTRLAAVVMATIMGVAIFVWHASDSLPSIELALAYFLSILFFVVAGGGRLSLDAILRRPAKGLASKPDDG